MADVDMCVRLCELAMCNDVAVYADKISQIPDSKRVLVLRSKSRAQIIEILDNCKKVVQLDIVNIYYHDDTNYQDISFTSDSDNNRDGADIIHTLSNGLDVTIELKFGKKTDRAIGKQSFEKIFETSYFTEALASQTLRGWRTQFIADLDEAQQRQRLVNTLNRSIDQFNRYYDTLNRKLSVQAQEYLEQIIINNTGDGSKDSSRWLRYIIDGEDFREVKRIPTGLGFWTVDDVKPLSDGVSRVTIFVRNSTTNVKVKFVLNWKNSYKFGSGDKASAKLGLGPSSWNVWVAVDEPSLG